MLERCVVRTTGRRCPGAKGDRMKHRFQRRPAQHLRSDTACCARSPRRRPTGAESPGTGQEEERPRGKEQPSSAGHQRQCRPYVTRRPIRRCVMRVRNMFWMHSVTKTVTNACIIIFDRSGEIECKICGR